MFLCHRTVDVWILPPAQQLLLLLMFGCHYIAAAGISDDDIRLLEKNVNFVIHSAASIDFNERIDRALGTWQRPVGLL